MQNIMSITTVICLVFVIAKHHDKLSLFNPQNQINGDFISGCEGVIILA